MPQLDHVWLNEKNALAHLRLILTMFAGIMGVIFYDMA